MKRLFIIRPYWTGSGLSSPNCSLISCSTCTLGLRPAMARAGSTPGVLKKMMNTTTVIVLLPLMVATTILTESALSFLSVGVQPPNVSWGTIIQDGTSLLYTRPWVSIAPGIMILLTVLSLNVFGDGVRDALDPRSKLRVEG